MLASARLRMSARRDGRLPVTCHILHSAVGSVGLNTVSFIDQIAS